MNARLRQTLMAGMVMIVSVMVGACAAIQDARTAAEPCPLHVSPEDTDPLAIHCVSDGRLAALDARGLGQLMDEVAALSDQGEQALRDALESPDSGPLRQALLLLALDDRGEDARTVELLEAHLSREASSHGGALLATLLRDQLVARQALRSSLSDARSERDALQQQLEELKAIEREIRDRDRTPAPNLENER
jgi:hypothetical protein